ncbi:hypothetical protein [Rhodoferax sp. GW822-FHT02A01]|uniref:hypothetical protein n=1 Tax=Rhodoferax sp. GW822-FHT02A01 TaxID=3141537 RepID=UPI00315D172A
MYVLLYIIADHLSNADRLTRLNYRGCAKENVQWNLYCMVYNIERLSKTTLGRDIQ